MFRLLLLLLFLLLIPQVGEQPSSDGIKAWNACEFYEELLLNDLLWFNVLIKRGPLYDVALNMGAEQMNEDKEGSNRNKKGSPLVK